MRTVDNLARQSLDTRVWRDLTLLAAQSLLVGIAAGVFMGLAVFAVAA
jgi:hypothetical protein